MPKKPLKKDFKIIEKLIEIGDVKYLEFIKKVQLIIKKDIVVLIAAEAIGSAPEASIGFIIIKPIDWHKAARIAKTTPIFREPSITSYL